MRHVIYISYGHKDDQFRQELRNVLLEDIRLRDLVWDDGFIESADWKAEIDKHIARARIVIALVSPAYLDSECSAWRSEIPHVVAASKSGELTVMWVAVHPVPVDQVPFGHIQSALPLSSPLASMSVEERDRAYLDLKAKILRTLGLDRSDHFDVFLSHNSKDKPAVRQLGAALKRRGMTVWLDEWELPPGQPWQEKLEEIIQTVKSAPCSWGKTGSGFGKSRRCVAA
jgi:TIR domain